MITSGENMKKYYLTYMPINILDCKMSYKYFVSRANVCYETITDEGGEYFYSKTSLTGETLEKKSVTVAEFEELKKKASSLRIVKVVSDLNIGGKKVRFEKYERNFLGINVAEVDFSSEKEYENFKMPDWFKGEIKGGDIFDYKLFMSALTHSSNLENDLGKNQ